MSHFHAIAVILFGRGRALTNSVRTCGPTPLHNALRFNDTSNLVGPFVSSRREREKRDRKESKRDERKGQGRKRKMNESDETEEIKTCLLYPYLLQG